MAAPAAKTDTMRGRKLTIGFGMVPVAVMLKPLAESKKPISGKGLCPEHGPTLNQQSICSRGTELEHLVANDEKLTGYPHPDDPKHFVVVDDDVLKSLEEERTGQAEIEAMIDVSTVDAGYFDKAYMVWAQPGGTNEQAFDLLAHVLREQGKAAVITAVMQKQTQTILIRWSEQFGCLLGHVIRFQEQVRNAEVELVKLAAVERAAPADPKMLALAEAIYGSFDGEFEPGEVQDRYTPLLQAAIVAAADGTVFEAPAPQAPVAEAGDLMALLEASAAAAAAAKKPPPAVKKPAAKRKEKVTV